MQIVINTIMALVQTVIGIMILLGKADIRTIAWMYVTAGAILILSLLLLGAARLASEAQSS